MSIEINTYSKVVSSFNYLKKELLKARLNKAKAILYFQILLNEEKDGMIERPHFTFAFDEFERYLYFLEQYHFIKENFQANTFVLLGDWKDKRERFVLSTEDERDLLELLEKYEELNSFYRVSA